MEKYLYLVRELKTLWNVPVVDYASRKVLRD